MARSQSKRNLFTIREEYGKRFRIFTYIPYSEVSDFSSELQTLRLKSNRKLIQANWSPWATCISFNIVFLPRWWEISHYLISSRKGISLSCVTTYWLTAITYIHTYIHTYLPFFSGRIYFCRSFLSFPIQQLQLKMKDGPSVRSSTVTTTYGLKARCRWYNPFATNTEALSDTLVSGQLLLTAALTKPCLNSSWYKLCSYTDSRKRSAPVADTFYASRECPLTGASTVEEMVRYYS